MARSFATDVPAVSTFPTGRTLGFAKAATTKGTQVLIEMTTLKEPWKLAKKQDKRLNVPQWLLNNLELLMFGMMTKDLIPVFRRFFGEPNFKVEQNSGATEASVMHDDDFINVIIQTANHAVDVIANHHKLELGKHVHNEKFSNGPAQTKLKYLLTHNIILDIMKTVNMYGPDPSFPENQHVAQATR